MRTYERNGVHVDQCGECRGIFLDRGELERLMDAEARWEGGAAQPQQHAQPQQQGRPQQHGQPQHGQPQHGQPQHGQPQHGQQQGLGGLVGEVLQQVSQQSRGQGQGYQQQPYRPRKKQSFLGELFG